ncbi:hypothetical protein X744_06185 [Mesorhizobium sp. LNJC372A00]|nr:hypothetical protein X745_06010 [Mesorhizobium sp. LNJC374B00]ESY61309.1 hypothetical protein X744_06185 [Mesorhizobium sp. LNJC372A00]
MWNRLVMAHNAIGAFTNEFQQYPSMREKFKVLEQILNKALIEHVFNEREDIRPRQRTGRGLFRIAANLS